MKLGQIFTKILYSPGFSGSCVLWPWPFDHLIPKANQHYEPNTSVTKIDFDIWCSQSFRVINSRDLDLWPFDPEIQSAHQSVNPYTYVTKIERNSLYWFCGIFTRFSGHCLLWPLTLTFDVYAVLQLHFHRRSLIVNTANTTIASECQTRSGQIPRHKLNKKQMAMEGNTLRKGWVKGIDYHAKSMEGARAAVSLVLPPLFKRLVYKHAHTPLV